MYSYPYTNFLHMFSIHGKLHSLDISLPLLLVADELQVVGAGAQQPLGYQPVEQGRDSVGEGEDAQDQEVDREQHVDVLLAEQLEEDVQAEEGAGGDDGEHCRVLLRHRLRLLSRGGAVLLLLPVRK